AVGWSHQRKGPDAGSQGVLGHLSQELCRGARDAWRCRGPEARCEEGCRICKFDERDAANRRATVIRWRWQHSDREWRFGRKEEFANLGYKARGRHSERESSANPVPVAALDSYIAGTAKSRI